jgi:hypothetical protein
LVGGVTVMLSALNEFQYLAARLSATTLVVPALTAIGIGVVVWLAGIRISRIISPVLGFALGAAVCSSIPGELNAPPVISAAIIGAIIGAVIHRPVMVAVGLLAFSTIVLISLDSTLYHEQSVRLHYERLADIQRAQVPATKSFEQIKADLRSITDGFIVLSKKTLEETWPLSILAPLLLMVLAIFYRRFFAAMSSSSLGAAAIFLGVIFLLLFGGKAPLTWMYQNGELFFMGFLAIVAAGTVSQMRLTRPQKLKILEEERPKEKTKQSAFLNS